MPPQSRPFFFDGLDAVSPTYTFPHALPRERVADGRGGPPSLGEDEAAGRSVVEAMGELQILRAVHEFEDARLVVPPVARDAGRFVDDEVVRTLGDDWDRRAVTRQGARRRAA